MWKNFWYHLIWSNQSRINREIKYMFLWRKRNMWIEICIALCVCRIARIRLTCSLTNRQSFTGSDTLHKNRLISREYDFETIRNPMPSKATFEYKTIRILTIWHNALIDLMIYLWMILDIFAELIYIHAVILSTCTHHRAWWLELISEFLSQ